MYKNAWNGKIRRNGFLILKDGTYKLSINVGRELPLLSV